MDKEREVFFRQLKEKEKKSKEQDIRHEQFNQKIKTELPSMVNQVMDMFTALCAEPLSKVISDESTELIWAYNKEKIGTITTKSVHVTFQKTHLSLKLNSTIGYVGATAKIDVLTNNLGASQRWSIHKDGIFITIGYEENQLNTIDYIDKHMKVHTLTEDAIIAILKAVFLTD